jgi:hypothetical protein
MFHIRPLVGCTLTLSLILVSFAATACADENVSRTQADQITEILQRLDKMEKSLNQRYNNILRGIEDVKFGNEVRVSSCEKDIEDLKKQISEIKKDMEKLGNSAPRVALSSPISNTGTIRIRSTFPADITVKINDQAYQLRPNSEITLPPLPAGTFTYEVPGARTRQVRKLAANETFVIDVFPQ